MLKSTHRQPAVSAAPAPLPTGWTEHKAPSGHVYYYNAATKKSTYTRPEEEPAELQIDYDAKLPDHEMQASMRVMEDFHRQNAHVKPEPGHFTGGRSYQDRSRRDRFHDRPKSKRAISKCEPWILVTTKFKRRFVHNPDTKESLWKFPNDVMMAVIEMEKEEWQSKQKAARGADETPQAPEPAPEASKPQPTPTNGEQLHDQGEDSDSYEEVEVTDDEDAGQSVKRPRFDEEPGNAPTGPVEFNEDDIEWQLAQMAEDGADEDDFDGAGYEEDEEGLPMTLEDSKALFRSLLDDMKVNPYSPFDSLLEDNNIHMIEDERWAALSNMGARRNAFKDWSKDRIAELKAREIEEAAVSKKQDPRAQYLDFLRQHASPKLYWPEFKRKFKRESELKSYDLTDKEREKLYREYVAKLKASEADRKKDFITLLKSLPHGESWNRTTTKTSLPDAILKDLRFHLVRDATERDQLVEAHLATLKS